MELEVDHSRAHYLDPPVTTQYLRRLEVDPSILGARPDAPLATVDRLPNLELPTEWSKSFGQLLDRGPPACAVAHQIAILRDGEGELAAAAREGFGKTLLLVVVFIPRVEADQYPADPELLDPPQVGVGVGRPRTDREPDPFEGDRRLVQLILELAVPPPDPRRRRGDDGEIAQVGRAVGEANRQLLAASRVLVGLVR